jgi:flagellar basal-body rod protein FlgF
MQGGIYVGLSGQLALERRLGTIANNVANASTAGFRAEEIKFDTIISRVGPEPVAFSSIGKTYLSRQLGGLTQTSNPFDVAVLGEAWMSIEVNGRQVYTRDGRMQMTENGDLLTVNGYPVLDAGGAAITLDPKGGPPQIARDGTIFQNNRRVGVLGLFLIDDHARLARAPNSGVIPDRPAEPAEDRVTVGFAQGFVEQSNVNAVKEMTRMISVHRAFDGISNSITTVETSLLDAIKTLGG